MDKFVFAITGPTGAGKSTVSEMMRRLGVYVADADKIARDITSNNSDCLSEIRQTFGGKVFDGAVLNRKKLAEIVFNDSGKLKLLNDITHKYIKEEIERKISVSPSQLAAIDGAVIIGSPVMDMCKKTVIVTADTEVRRKRIMNRDSISYEATQSRINSQMNNSQYEQYADFIIKNNDIVGLEECVEQVYSKIKNFSETRSEET